MAKNNKLINSLLLVAKRNREDNRAIEAEKITPEVYAGIALALHRECGWGHKRINRLFKVSQDIWEDLEVAEMCRLCYEETGIMLMHANEAEKRGYREGDEYHEDDD